MESLTQAGILKGEDIFRHLEGCSEAVLLAVTVGPGVDGQIRRAGVGDIAAGVASDAIGSVLAEQAADAAEAELRQWAAEQDKYLTGRFSPGYGDWPIGVQPLVAAALDTDDAPQERDRSAGPERPSGERTPCRVRTLRAKYAVRI